MVVHKQRVTVYIPKEVYAELLERKAIEESKVNAEITLSALFTRMCREFLNSKEGQ